MHPGSCLDGWIDRSDKETKVSSVCHKQKMYISRVSTLVCFLPIGQRNHSVLSRLWWFDKTRGGGAPFGRPAVWSRRRHRCRRVAPHQLLYRRAGISEEADGVVRRARVGVTLCLGGALSWCVAKLMSNGTLELRRFVKSLFDSMHACSHTRLFPSTPSSAFDSRTNSFCCAC